MGADALSVARAIAKLAPPVLELVGEVVEAVRDSPSKRDAARRIIIVAAKKALTG